MIVRIYDCCQKAFDTGVLVGIVLGFIMCLAVVWIV